MSLVSWLAGLQPVHRARTPGEREAVFRFRYDVYHRELGLDYPGMDHERGRFETDEDTRPYSTLFYTGTPEAVTSTALVRAWGPGEVPADDHRRMSLDRVPGVDGLAVAEISRLMLRPTLRGHLLMPSLLCAGYEFLAGEAGTDLAFVNCVPGILKHYRRLGARPYGGRLIPHPNGSVIPLVIVLSDVEHLRRCRSIVTPLAKKHFGPGRRPPLDLEPFAELFGGEVASVEVDPGRVWGEVEAGLLGSDATPSFAEAVPARALKRLAESGFLLDVAEGDVLAREGASERELFVVLDGVFDVSRDGRRIDTLARGDLFGEVAFFSGAGRRTATVAALAPGRVLVLRRRFLDELNRRDPDAGFRILTNLGRLMADRFAGSLEHPAEESPDSSARE